jgi:addiction module RelE/StbE family toxin
MQISFSKNFCKDYAKDPREIKKALKIRISLFKENKNERILNNHQLNGDLSSLRSINITGDWRALFADDNNVVSFVILDKHSNLYR